MRVLLVAGARPNFMKVAPLLEAMVEHGGFEPLLVHTGQHYDEQLSSVFFDELGIRRPDVNLGVGSGSHARQTAEVMIRFEPVLTGERAEAVVVVGDVNSTLACALTASKQNVPVAHVEAGLRSFDESMPEETNRRLTDALSRWLFVSEPSGVENLAGEGFPGDRVHLVGNVMIDTLLRQRDRAREREAPKAHGVKAGEYAVLTLHRPGNVEAPKVLRRLIGAVGRIATEAPVLFPAHPRTREAMARAGLERESLPGLRIMDPLGYLDFLGLMSDAMVVLTDSGGIQEETTVLGVPCLTLRHNTERPITIEKGTNTLVGLDPDRIVGEFERIRRGRAPSRSIPDLWDGRAAERIVGILATEGWEGRWLDT